MKRNAVEDQKNAGDVRAPDDQPVFYLPLPQEQFEYAALISPDGRILSSDQALPKRLGTELSAFIGANIYSFFPPEVAALRRRAAATVMRSGEPVRYRDESRPGRIYDTRVLPVFGPDGGVSSLAVLVNDVTAEERAVEDRSKLSAAIEQAVEAVIIADVAFNIEYVNQSFEAMTGYSRKEVSGRNLDCFFKGKRQEDRFKRCVTLLTNGEVCAGRFLLVSKSGESCVCDQSVSPVRARYGVILGYVFVWRDATQVSNLEKQLRHAQKMEAIGALASGIAHDFNNILGPIMLHAELCLSKVAEDDPMRASLPEIIDAAKRAKALAEQLLYLGRSREKDIPIPFGLGSLVKECVKLLRPGLSPDINVSVRIEARSDLTLADPDQIHQVIMNLATNAADAMREFGGNLTFRISNVSVGEDGWSGRPDLPVGEYVRLSVEDAGHGISPALMEKIFEPFFSAKSTRDGSGLGLSVVQNIVARMRGALEVESEPGMGTVFHVLLPAAEISAAETPAPARRKPPAPRKARILLVDDDEAMAGGLTTALKGLGYAVDRRVSASEALAAFLRRPDGYDLAMLDLVMPHMNGLELSGEMLRVRPGLPVVLFSSHPDRVSPEEIAQSGIRAFLPKPFDLETLDRTIRRVCGEEGNVSKGKAR
jgi:PAS domain S-box-containing protein